MAYIIYTRSAVILIICSMPLISGCGGNDRKPTRINSASPHQQTYGERLQADPVGELNTLLDRCEKFGQYRMTFYRQERLGSIVKALRPTETIRATFRAEPYSVRFEWLDKDSSYYESVYVEGLYDNKLLVRERKGIFPFPPQVRQIDVDLPAKLGQSINPITSFGLAQTTRRIAQLFDEVDLAGALTIRYEGIVDLEPMHRPAHCLRITQTPVEGWHHTLREFYIDAETRLPAGVDLWLDEKTLEARYRYADIDPDVSLSDTDFRLSKDHPTTQETKE